MPIIDDLLKNLPPDRPVESVHIGIKWTMVCLDAGSTGESSLCGLAKTVLSDDEPGGHGHGSVADGGFLHLKSAHELASLVKSSSGPERAVGFAAINALITPDEADIVDLNARDVLLERGQGEKVAMIGHFPFVEDLQAVAETLWVLELNPAPGDLPASAAPFVLPQAEIVAVTSLTLVNETFDGLAKLWNPAATVILLGPSTLFSPLFFDCGVDLLCGTVVTDPVLAARHVMQGSSFKQMEGTRRVTMAKPAS
ncbi:MAG: DUF364 domain-containing protein [Anaerolineae bacterium]|nr:DUF364 domain-containing protein [Anaerolineae bacterium]